MSDNNPQPEQKIIVDIAENQKGSVPHTEVGQIPKHKPAKNLLEQLEYFKLQFALKARHIVWMGLATYICYDRYRAYQQYREEKQYIFSKNRKQLQEKYGKLNQKYTSSTIHPRGDPDQGDWVFFKEMPDQDQKLFLERKLAFQDKSSHFNTFMPLYITSGLSFPLASFFIGLLFRKKIFDDRFTLNQNKDIKKQLETPTSAEQNSDKSIESAQQVNSTQQQKQEEGKISYISSLIEEKIPFNMYYGLIGGLSIVSSLRLYKYFL